mmetsp:Transcript_11186/g.25452  ORF Transcript_11186/g.25452 Transcript_11186/m.25452 type:complete len:179 (-) Transcript_11186:40-576(-)
MPNAPALSSLQSSSTSTVRTSPLSSRRGSDTPVPHQTQEKSSRRSKTANVNKKERQSPTSTDITESWYYSNWDEPDCWQGDSNSVCSSQNSVYVDLDDFDDELELEPLEKKRKSLCSVLQAEEESPFENSLRSLNISGERNGHDMSFSERHDDSFNKEEFSDSLLSFLSCTVDSEQKR